VLAVLHFCDEPITPPRQSLNEFRLLRRVIQRLAQPIDGVVEPVIKIHERIIRPQLIPKLFSGDYFARTFDQQSQDLKWLVLQPDSSPVLEQFSSAKIDTEGSK
jgi:hypothetical protein